MNIEKTPFLMLGFFCLSLGTSDGLAAIQFNYIKPQAATEAKKTETIESALFQIQLKEHIIDAKRRWHGGALSIAEGSIIITSGDGNFIKFNPTNHTSSTDFLPALDLGDKSYESSKFITYKETPPRAHDLIYHNDHFYACHDYYDSSSDRVYFIISRCSPSSQKWERVYVSPPHDTSYFTLGSGGRMATNEGRLYFTVGDFSLDRVNGLPSDLAPQNPNLPWGKINYLDLQNFSFHVLSLGHRNPQGLLVLNDGRMISSEHGPKGGDEINIIKEGGNYGWPHKSYGTVYENSRSISNPAPAQKNSNFLEPMFAFVPSVAPTQLIQINKFNPLWRGDIVLATLKDLSLYRIEIIGERVVFAERIPVGARIRDLKEFNQSLFLLTDSGLLIEAKPVASPP